MDLPSPPQEQELKNIIDKLAQFVARNGPEFEQMTKNKQKDNAKFSFLFGGDFYNYYQYKVSTEQTILKQTQSRDQSSSSQNMIPNQNMSPMPHQNQPNILPQGQSPMPPQGQQHAMLPQGQQHPMPHQGQQHPMPPQGHSSMPPYSGSNNQNYQNPSYQYNAHGNYGPQSNYGGDQYPPNNNYNHQYNMPPMHGDSQMHMGHGQPGMNNSNYQQHPAPQSYNNQGDPSYGQGNNSNERQFQQPMSGFPPHNNMEPYDKMHKDQYNMEPYDNKMHKDQYKEDQYNIEPYDKIHKDTYNMEQNFGSSQQQGMMPSGSDHNSGSSGYGMGLPRQMGAGMPLQVTDNSVPVGLAGPSGLTLDKIIQEESDLQEQITQSELNLSAQALVLDQQRELQIKEGLYVARGEVLRNEALDNDITMQGFDDVLLPIMESCTKDSILNGKHWIFTHAVSPPTNQWIANYLLYKATSVSGPFTHKLHIIYLMNDVLHHCVRKNAEGLKDCLEKVLSPMYCIAYIVAADDQRVKLEKLLSLWESKMHLDDSLLDELRNTEDTAEAFNDNLQIKFSQVITTVNQHLNTTFDGYKQQHNAFVQHANSQLQQLQQQKRQLESQNQSAQQQPQHSFMNMQGQQQPMPSQQQPLLGQQPAFPAGGSQPPIPHNMDFNQPPPGFADTGDMSMVDFSKPPPGFMLEEKENLVPTVPYFELPAALMAPLIHISENKFKPLDPNRMRLPLPTPPSDRLLAAVENFYLPPSHERPRNCEGWEQIALFDYYKAKTNAVKEKERLIADGLREPSRSPSPVVIEIVNDEDIIDKGPVRRYRSVSPEEDRIEEEIIKNEPSPQNEPATNRYHRRSNSSSPNRSPGPRESRPQKRSQSPPYSPNGRRSQSRSPSPAPFARTRSRSITPPSYMPMGSYAPPNSSIEETNKGHQMLLSMGWGGAGLGAKEQGISTPISAAEVRETPSERFRGLGIPSSQSDPFEAFRKNKGQAFIIRMKQRAEEREKTENA